MTLRETTETLILWVNSCLTAQQLGLVDKLIEPYVIDRFKGDPEIANEVSKIMIAIQAKAKCVATESFLPLNMN